VQIEEGNITRYTKNRLRLDASGSVEYLLESICQTIYRI